MGECSTASKSLRVNPFLAFWAIFEVNHISKLYTDSLNKLNKLIQDKDFMAEQTKKHLRTGVGI